MSNKSITELASITFVGGMLGRLLQYGVYIAIARGLGAEALGIFSIGYVILNVASVVSRLGLDNAARKFIPVYRESEDEERLAGIIISSLGGAFLIGSAVSVILFALTGIESRLGGFIPMEATFFLFGVPFLAVLSVGMAGSRGFLNTTYAVYAKDIVQSGLALLFVGISAFTLKSIEFTIVGYVISIVFGAIVITFYVGKLGGLSLSSNPTFEIKKVTVYSLPLMLSAVANYLVTWTDILMLGVLLPNNAEIGQYQATFQTAAMLGFILYSVNSVFPSIASGLYHGDEREDLSDIYKSTTKWTGGFTILGSIYLVVFSKQVMSIFGNEFEGVKLMILVLCIGYIANAIAGPAGYLLSMSQYERIESLNTIITALSNIVLNYILISHYGILGAAVATGASLVILNTLRVLQAEYLLGIHPGFLSIVKILPGIVIAGGIFTSIRFIYPSSLIAALCAGVIGSLCFICIMYMFLISDRDRILLQNLS